MIRPLNVLALAAVLVVAGCGTPSSQIPNGNAFARLSERSSPMWGIGLSAQVKLDAGEDQWEAQFCQTRGYNYATCPQIQQGKSSYKYSVSNSVSYPPCGSASATESGSSKLGRTSFSQSESAAGAPSSGACVLAQTDSNFWWKDELTPASQTLKRGTQVKYRVTLTLTPTHIVVPCGVDSYPSMGFYGPGQDSLGNAHLYVSGDCEYGMFVFSIGNIPSKPGTKDTGTLTGYIGTPLQLVGSGDVRTRVCADTIYCSESDSLVGSVTFKIKPITPGASFTTASGYGY